MPSLASVPAFIMNTIDHDLLKTADKIEYSIEKGEEMTTSYQFRTSAMEDEDYFAPQHALNKSYHQRPAEQSPGSVRKSRKADWDTTWDIQGADSGGEYSPSSPSLASRKYTSSAASGGYREERIFSKSSALPVTMTKHTIEYMDETVPVAGVDRNAEWQDWYNREIAPAMERNSADSGRQWQEWTKREVSTTTPISPFEERTITYQKEEGTSMLNPNAKFGPNAQVIKHETFEEETSEQTFDMPEPKRSDSGFSDKFKLTRERARSTSPPPLRKSVNFGSVAEITTREQEFYPFRDAHQGKPLPGDNEFEEDEKKMDDPNLMWMKMGPAQYGPPFGSLRRRKAREEEWVGPPCELCHKQIEERRCMLAENMKFHCWHFACSFCMKTLKVNDFLIAEADKKPYCLNCHKREFPEISLVNVDLDK